MAKTVTEEYQDGENSYCEFFRPVRFLQLAIQIHSFGKMHELLLIKSVFTERLMIRGSLQK
jgi:hypothetical protein